MGCLVLIRGRHENVFAVFVVFPFSCFFRFSVFVVFPFSRFFQFCVFVFFFTKTGKTRKRFREKCENVFFFFIFDSIIFGFSFCFRCVFLRKRFRGFRDFLEDLEIIRVYLMSRRLLFDAQIAYLIYVLSEIG